MEVPGPTEILAAVRSGRADAGGVTYFTARNLAEESGGDVDVTDPSALPEETLNWVGIALRKEDEDFLNAFNEALADYIGSDEMMAAVEEYGYTGCARRLVELLMAPGAKRILVDAGVA